MTQPLLISPGDCADLAVTRQRIGQAVRHLEACPQVDQHGDDCPGWRGEAHDCNCGHNEIRAAIDALGVDV